MEQLSLMSRIERPTGFQFEQYDPIDHEIGIIGADDLPMEPDWHGNLLLEVNAAILEGHRHRFFIDVFEKAEPELVVDIIEDANDLLSQF